MTAEVGRQPMRKSRALPEKPKPTFGVPVKRVAEQREAIAELALQAALQLELSARRRGSAARANLGRRDSREPNTGAPIAASRRRRR